MKSLLTMSAMTAAIIVSGMNAAHAAVSADEAAKLKSTLTPVGAEKAGNADGTIPAWTGGLTGAKDKYYVNGRRPDPFADEKPLFSINSGNAGQYSDKLSEGVKGMFAKYPDSFRVDVYKTHRTAAYPQWYYDNTYKNALEGKITERGEERFPENVFGGTPFPLPKDGLEVIWNHLTRWQGAGSVQEIAGVLITSEGRQVLSQTSPLQFWNHFNDPRFTTNYDGGTQWVRVLSTGPAIRVGEGLIIRAYLDSAKDSGYVYLTGQRRVRKLPNACCDTPATGSGGVMSFDEFYVFANKPTRFDWKIVGKKEMIIPYNSNKTLVPTAYETVLSPHHMNPDYIRWEQHRVWVIEATLREGQRHVSPRSVYYVDEDTWNATLGDRYDTNGKFWKMSWLLPTAMPDLPGTIPTINGFYDLSSGAWYASNLPNNFNRQWDFVEINPTDFTPESLAGEGLR